MSDLRKAAEMALEALRNAEVVYMEQLNAMYALQGALAQPEQEPETVMAKYEFQTYAAYKVDGEMKIGVVPEHTAWVTAGEHTVPLEVSAPVDAVNMSQERVDETVKNRHEWVDLTDDEVVNLKLQGRDLEFVSMSGLRRFAKDIGAKLKEKNNG